MGIGDICCGHGDSSDGNGDRGAMGMGFGFTGMGFSFCPHADLYLATKLTTLEADISADQKECCTTSGNQTGRVQKLSHTTPDTHAATDSGKFHNVYSLFTHSTV